MFKWHFLHSDVKFRRNIENVKYETELSEVATVSPSLYFHFRYNVSTKDQDNIIDYYRSRSSQVPQEGCGTLLIKIHTYNRLRF